MIGVFLGQSRTHIRRGGTRFKLQPKEGEKLSEIEQDYVNLCNKIADYIAADKLWNITAGEAEYMKKDRLRFNFTFDILEPSINTLEESDPLSHTHIVIKNDTKNT